MSLVGNGGTIANRREGRVTNEILDLTGRVKAASDAAAGNDSSVCFTPFDDETHGAKVGGEKGAKDVAEGNDEEIGSFEWEAVDCRKASCLEDVKDEFDEIIDEEDEEVEVDEDEEVKVAEVEEDKDEEEDEEEEVKVKVEE